MLSMSDADRTRSCSLSYKTALTELDPHDILQMEACDILHTVLKRWTPVRRAQQPIRCRPQSNDGTIESCGTGQTGDH